MRSHRRAVFAALVLALVLAVSLPHSAAAAPLHEERAGELGQRFGESWHSLTAALLQLWEGDDSRGIWDPNGSTTTSVTTDTADPGTTTDGRGIWDPNGGTV
jgi:hypothetical protein